MERGEEREQARLIKWTHTPAVRAIAPVLEFMFHCPNGGKRDGITGGQMRALGVKPGVPDLLMPIAASGCVGLAIEMKSAIGSTTDEQEKWLDALRLNGWATHVCRSADAARAIIMAYLNVELPPL